MKLKSYLYCQYVTHLWAPAHHNIIIHVYNFKLSKLKHSRVVKKEIRELVCLVVALINRTSTDRLKFWVKLHLYADSVMCSVHQPALETCDKYFSSLIKKCVQDSNK